MVSSGTSISDRMALLRKIAPMAVDISVPYASRVMPIATCHSLVKEFIDRDQDDLLDDDEYNFAVDLMNELAEQTNEIRGIGGEDREDVDFEV